MGRLLWRGVGPACRADISLLAGEVKPLLQVAESPKPCANGSPSRRSQTHLGQRQHPKSAAMNARLMAHVVTPYRHSHALTLLDAIPLTSVTSPPFQRSGQTLAIEIKAGVGQMGIDSLGHVALDWVVSFMVANSSLSRGETQVYEADLCCPILQTRTWRLQGLSHQS